MSKASLEALQPLKNDSFLVRKFGPEGFEAPFHFHPEYEITYITNGKGKRFVGNNMSGFSTGDLVLLGANLPHCWKLDAEPGPTPSAIVIQFSKDFLGAQFFKSTELGTIHKLLEKSSAGMRFTGKINEEVRLQMHHLQMENDPFIRLMGLLKILHSLSTTRSYSLLDKNKFAITHIESGFEKINLVYAYLVDNFQNHISLNEVSKSINMTPNAFCKYFKKITRKTFMEAVIDFRINHATQQLIDTDKSITHVCYDSGFRDMSHFYKMFAARMKMSPLHYRRQFLGEIN